PLPDHIDESKVIFAISPEKDVDGFHPVSVGKMMIGEPTFLPCTPNGILHLVKEMNVPIAGQHVVVVGRSQIVGKPVGMLFLNESATVSYCHSKTADLGAMTRQADILIVAVGVPKLITADMVKPDAVVIDVGVNRVDGKLVGDVDFDTVQDVASMITPVPGGVGPMTITMLLHNTIEAAQ
ncbi:bifunctional 5,10-methylenetetrahydrofolate dehydrogenase/5,10-methenyltetrahydrofolate cyclohydrolase, partial [Exiguobacterium sp.]|nr:bifunctional methylenetetrahydrofolate dehydrogenase/methenyltetrahydrofolate cyclohydrolase [Exiguobacterium sp.]